MKEPIRPEQLRQLLNTPNGAARVAFALELFGPRGIDVLTLLSMQEDDSLEARIAGRLIEMWPHLEESRKAMENFKREAEKLGVKL